MKEFELLQVDKNSISLYIIELEAIKTYTERCQISKVNQLFKKIDNKLIIGFNFKSKLNEDLNKWIFNNKWIVLIKLVGEEVVKIKNQEFS